MNAAKLTDATEQAKAGLSEMAHSLRDFSETVTELCKDSYHDAERGVRKLRIAGEEGVDHTRRQIKSHPLAAVAVAASAAFLLGGVVGWMTTRHGRH